MEAYGPRRERILSKLFDMCEAGDMEAIKLLFSLVYGKTDQVLRIVAEDDDGAGVVVNQGTLAAAANDVQAWREEMKRQLLAMTTVEDNGDE
jgi:hypothetical protein